MDSTSINSTFKISAEITIAKGYQRKSWIAKKKMYYRKQNVALDFEDLITKLGEEAGAGCCFERPELGPIDYHFKGNPF